MPLETEGRTPNNFTVRRSIIRTAAHGAIQRGEHEQGIPTGRWGWITSFLRSNSERLSN